MGISKFREEKMLMEYKEDVYGVHLLILGLTMFEIKLFLAFITLKVSKLIIKFLNILLQVGVL